MADNDHLNNVTWGDVKKGYSPDAGVLPPIQQPQQTSSSDSSSSSSSGSGSSSGQDSGSAGSSSNKQ